MNESFQATEFFTNLVPSIGVVLNLLFSIALKKDMDELVQEGKSVKLVHPIVWILSTILSGVLTVAVYWILHRLGSKNQGAS
jgi:predicted Co/Zn/Cd cation transporter (cation efflux family)